MRFLKIVAALLAAGLGLAAAAIGGIAAWAYLTAESRTHAPDAPFPTVTAATDPAEIERGRYLVYGPAHCAQCHAAIPREHPEQNKPGVALTGGIPFAMGPIGTSYAANLTPDPDTGIGKRSDAELARAIRHGVLPDGRISILMRYSAANLADEDLAAIMGFLRSQAPVRAGQPPYDAGMLPLLSLMFELGPDLSPAPTYVAAADEPSVARGEYLADNVMLCTSCHTTYDPSTFLPNGPKGGGGTAEASHEPIDADMEYAPPNLTSDPTGITGKLDEDAFVDRIRHGRVNATTIMPWENFQTATDSDLRSVSRYLKSLPPVANDTGPSYRKVGWKPGDPVK